MYFAELHRRLIQYLQAQLQCGELTERRLARLAGLSQPHLHNVLKGVRRLSDDLADQILRHLRISLLDLLTPEERAAPQRVWLPLSAAPPIKLRRGRS